MENLGCVDTSVIMWHRVFKCGWKYPWVLNLVGKSMDGRMLNSFDVRVIMGDRVLKYRWKYPWVVLSPPTAWTSRTFQQVAVALPSAIRIYSGFPRLIDCLYSKLSMERLKMERAKHKSQNKALFPRGWQSVPVRLKCNHTTQCQFDPAIWDSVFRFIKH